MAKSVIRIPAPQSLSFWRYVIGSLFASIEHWPRLIVAIALLVAVFRARVKDLPQIVAAVTKALESSCVLGWVVAACLLLSSVAVVVITVTLYRRELDRIAGKRDE